nr:MAG TPA: hypothetical protein [Bacteriophage sp.]
MILAVILKISLKKPQFLQKLCVFWFERKDPVGVVTCDFQVAQIHLRQNDF